jgi:Thylakoid formation protein
MMIAVGFEPQKIRDDAKRMLGLIKDGNPTADDILNATEGELAEILINVRTNRFFKYTDAWGVGLGRMIELVGSEPNSDSFDKWSASLRWIFTPRLISTWDEFCGDQLRMQGIEAMQKQLQIREKKRSASRLEKKASEFEDKKKALQLLNEDIEERRQQLISDQRILKEKYEPDEYARILLQDKADSASKSL